jgi:hypothetical protein
MEQRSRFEKVIHKGYVLGIWHSTFTHIVLLLALCCTIAKYPQVQDNLGVITLSFSQPEPVLSIEKPLVLDFTKDSAASAEPQESSTSEIFESETPKVAVSDIETLDVKPEQPKSEEIKIELVEPEELVQEIDLFPKNKRISHKPFPKKQTVSVQSSIPTGMEKLKTFIKQATAIGEGVELSQYGSGNRNGTGKYANFSKNYVDNIEADMRLKEYGAGTGDVQISLLWNTVDDIDLHVEHNGDRIWWQNRRSFYGGMLDIDMNAKGPNNRRPIENIFWAHNTLPRGHFVVYVHFFRAWTSLRKVPVTVRVKTLKGIQLYNVIVRKGMPQVVLQFSN